MSKFLVNSVVQADGSIVCTVAAPEQWEMKLTGEYTAVQPNISGATVFTDNRALVDNAWAHAKFQRLSVSLPTQVEQQQAAKRAQYHRKVAKWLARFAVLRTEMSHKGWCSSCYQFSSHYLTASKVGATAVHLCVSCGTPTAKCVVPRCKNFATINYGSSGLPAWCAEHRHDISGFEKSQRRFGKLEQYAEYLKYEKMNVARNVKVGGGSVLGVVAVAPTALMLAPAIGGAVGALISGYTGAAATSHGLAVLGFGAIAKGGLGMAGGVMVVTASGATLGGVMGGAVTNAYIREDKSFHIEKLKDGTGTPVLVCNGFLTAKSESWAQWETLVTERYPDAPVYRIHWGAKELSDLGLLLGQNGMTAFAMHSAVNLAQKAAKVMAKKLAIVAPAIIAADLIKNPWHVAKSRANKTGALLADLLSRTDEKSFILIGHSLGARVMTVAAQTLALKPHGVTIESVHLLGAAIGAKSDWHYLTESVSEAVYNYYSKNDQVLKWMYTIAQAGQQPAGLIGFKPANEKLNNIDVSQNVEGHSAYFEKVNLINAFLEAATEPQE